MPIKGTAGWNVKAFRRLGFLAIIVVSAVVLVELKWHPIGFYTADRLYDNVPTYANCDVYPLPETAQQVLETLPRPAGVEALVSDRCAGKGGIELRYGSHALRVELEKILESSGKWQAGTGWFLRGVPVELRNV